MAAVEELLSTLDLEQLEHNLFRGRSLKTAGSACSAARSLARRSSQPAAQLKRRTGSRIRFTLTFSWRAIPRRQSSTRLTAFATVAVSRRGASLPSSMGGRFFPWASPFIRLNPALNIRRSCRMRRRQNRCRRGGIADAPAAEHAGGNAPLLGKGTPDRIAPGRSSRFFCREKLEPKQYLWIKTNGRLPDNSRLHQCALAYASDFSLLDTALIAHGRVLFDPRLMLSSLDHALWFHRPFRADEWLLYAQDSPARKMGVDFAGAASSSAMDALWRPWRRKG